jgi:hypothetical protein
MPRLAIGSFGLCKYFFVEESVEESLALDSKRKHKKADYYVG